jgi:putative DNA primase/helicase
MKTAPAPEGARHQTRSQYSTPASYADRLEAIRAALLEHGIEPANPDALLSRLADAEGKPVRFGTASKPRSKLPTMTGACRLSLSPETGAPGLN